MASTYVLIDTSLIGYPKEKPWIKKRDKPSWVATLYEREAITVSPILIDIERSIACNRIDVVMRLVNAVRPQLGISFIETELCLGRLQRHLGQFIYVKTKDGNELTLRFADCAVLPSLAAFLTKEQWASIVDPFKTWKIHGRDGELISLPVLRLDTAPAIPIILRDEQIDAIRNAMGADQLLSNLRKVHPTILTDYSPMKAHDFAEQILHVWCAAGHAEDADLLLFARVVFDSDGRLLDQPGLCSVLEQPEPTMRLKDLNRLANLT